MLLKVRTFIMKVIIVMLWTSNVIAKREARQLAFGSRLSEIDRPRSKVYTLVSDTHGTDDEAAVFEYDPDKSNQFRRSLGKPKAVLRESRNLSNML